MVQYFSIEMCIPRLADVSAVMHGESVSEYDR